VQFFDPAPSLREHAPAIHPGKAGSLLRHDGTPDRPTPRIPGW